MKIIPQYINNLLLSTTDLTTTTFTFRDVFIKIFKILVLLVGFLSHYTNIKLRVNEKFKGSWKRYFKFLKNDKNDRRANLVKKKKDDN